MARTAKAKGFIEEWFNEEFSEDLYRSASVKTIYDDYFIPWAIDKDFKTSYVSFTKFLKDILKERGGMAEIKKANKRVKPKDDYHIIFEMIATYTEMIKNNQVNSLIVYGTPGVGKDYTVESVFKTLEDRQNLIIFKGGVKGTHELVKILYEYRENYTIVFSDFDSAFKNKEQKNILKASLEDTKKRHISYIDGTKRNKEDKIPNTFEFTSGLIVVSNSKIFDEAIKSRSMAVKVDMDNEDIMLHIRENLEDFMPAIPMNLKLEVWDYLNQNINKYKRIDFRQFKNCVANRIAKPKEWKEWSRIILNN